MSPDWDVKHQPKSIYAVHLMFFICDMTYQVWNISYFGWYHETLGSGVPFTMFSHNIINQHIKLYFRRAELVNVNEQKQKEALKEFYENEIRKQTNEDQIRRLKKFSRVINPLFCIGFVIVFWAVGMQHYYQKL